MTNRSVLRRALPALAVLAVLAAASPARTADAQFPPGSRLGLVPPAGLSPSRTFPGFEDPSKDTAIVMVELPGAAYADVEKGFTADTLKGQGVEVEIHEEVTLKDGHGVLVVARPKNNASMPMRKWALVATASGITGIITFQVPDAAHDTYPDDAVRAALTSVVVRTKVPAEEQLGLLPYALKDLAGFRIIKTQTDGMALLTDGPQDMLPGIEQPIVLIGLPRVTPPEADQRDRFARQLMATTPGVKDMRIVRSEAMRIGGQPGYEVLAEGKDAGGDVDVTVVQWLRFGTGGFVHMVGMARKDAWAAVYPRMRSLRDGIELK
jgi:hypothetical protein